MTFFFHCFESRLPKAIQDAISCAIFPLRKKLQSPDLQSHSPLKIKLNRVVRQLSLLIFDSIYHGMRKSVFSQSPLVKFTAAIYALRNAKT